MATLGDISQRDGASDARDNVTKPEGRPGPLNQINRDPVENWQRGGFGLYLHWPFCLSKCPYCDFNSHVAARIDQREWQDAYLAEIARAAGETGERVLASVYFGGGTPSLMDPELVAAILDAVRAGWRVVNDLEVTLEANPTSVEAGRFRGYAAAGVNRLSLGVQALDDRDLAALGRLHTAGEARAAFDLARATFSRVSFDLIYARQGQTPEAWRAELGEALTMAADHLSLYQLTIEPGTAFGTRHAAGRLPGLPDEDRAVALWDITQEMTGAAGMVAYEVSNHAVEGAEGRHNLVYWRGGDYLGIGPGAHGRLTLDGIRLATEAPRAPTAWLQAVRQGRGELPREALAAGDVLAERLMMGLRLAEGVTMAPGDLPPAVAARIDMLVSDGLMWRETGRFGVTATGRRLLDAVLREILADQGGSQPDSDI
ncbi:MAG: coproporphyrinogen III oxidase [Rubellimicrobium sp.]|nr:coproporphyrinogen III oxidase [Rubellimicrobium sp.]